MAYASGRVKRLRKGLVIVGLLLLARLVYLQIIDGAQLARYSLAERVQAVKMEIGRGAILDRRGRPLTDVARVFSVILFPGQLAGQDAAATELEYWLNLPAGSVTARLEREQRPFKIKTGLDAAAARRINGLRLPGVVVAAETARYNQEWLAAHVIGAINAADDVGVSGVENRYDDWLKGDPSDYTAAVVDATRQMIPGLGYKRVRLGGGMAASQLVLTLDAAVQAAAERALEKTALPGAVVVLQPATGDVLAMASRPNFDANHLARFLHDPAAPLLNRAIAAYQPGSVFKLVVAAAALEKNLVRPSDVLIDNGFIDVDGTVFHGWDYQNGARGPITFTEALAYSSNPVFIQVGEKLGAPALLAFARRAGFGRPTALALPGEAAGNLPDPESVYPGELANLSIGQGQCEVTPLQMAAFVAAIVNDGRLVEPRLALRALNTRGDVVKTFPAAPGAAIMSPRTARDLRRMMAQVTTIGTGRAAYVAGAGAAGKTGSAETGRVIGGKSVSHAWFAGYTPLARPRYVIVVFLENGMSGGGAAAPVFHDIAAAILKK